MTKTTHARLIALQNKVQESEQEPVLVHLDQTAMHNLQGDPEAKKDGSLGFHDNTLSWRKIGLRPGVAATDTGSAGFRVTIEAKNSAGETVLWDDEDNDPRWNE